MTATTEAPQWGKLAKTEPTPPALSVFGAINDFEGAQRMAAALCSSTLVPKEYQGQQNLGNCLIALDLAGALGLRPMAVMQNLYVIHGRPSFSASFLIGRINTCGRFTPLEFVLDDPTNPTSCYAVAKSKATDRELVGETVTVAMAKAEGWWSRSGSKWPTMTGQMLRYRAAGFWQRVYAPELTSGCFTTEEVIDVEPVSVTEVEPVAAAAPVPEPEPAKAPRKAKAKAALAEAPAPAAEDPPAADAVDVTAGQSALEEFRRSGESAIPLETIMSDLDLDASEPVSEAQPPTTDPIDVIPLGEFAQQGMEMIVQQCQLSGLEDFRQQVKGFIAAGEVTEQEGERLMAGITTRAGYLSKLITPFEATAAIKKIYVTEGLEQRFRDAFSIPSDVPLSDVVGERQHVETVKALLAAGGA
jgi:hypothetical protein